MPLKLLHRKSVLKTKIHYNLGHWECEERTTKKMKWTERNWNRSEQNWNRTELNRTESCSCCWISWNNDQRSYNLITWKLLSDMPPLWWFFAQAHIILYQRCRAFKLSSFHLTFLSMPMSSWRFSSRCKRPLRFCSSGLCWTPGLLYTYIYIYRRRPDPFQ